MGDETTHLLLISNATGEEVKNADAFFESVIKNMELIDLKIVSCINEGIVDYGLRYAREHCCQVDLLPAQDVGGNLDSFIQYELVSYCRLHQVSTAK